MNKDKIQLQQFLIDHFQQMQKSNSSFSIRAYAKYLDVDASYLTKILNKEKLPTKKFLEQAKAKLNYISIHDVQGIKPIEVYSFSEAEYNALSNWEDLAILKLPNLCTFQYDAKWMAKVLGITTEQANESLNKLITLGFLIEKDGTLIRSHKLYKFKSSEYTSAFKSKQNAIIKRGLNRLEDIDSTKSCFSSIVLALNPAKIKLAQQKIANFKEEMLSLLEDEESEELYHLSIQLFPAAHSSEEN